MLDAWVPLGAGRMDGTPLAAPGTSGRRQSRCLEPPVQQQILELLLSVNEGCWHGWKHESWGAHVQSWGYLVFFFVLVCGWRCVPIRKQKAKKKRQCGSGPQQSTSAAQLRLWLWLFASSSALLAPGCPVLLLLLLLLYYYFLNFNAFLALS